MTSFKSHFLYDSRKRSGILFLSILILASTAFVIWYEPEKEIIITEDEKRGVIALEKKIDSLKLLEIEKRKPKIYPFNPNYITDGKGYALGMSVEEIDRLLRFRESGKWINSKADFKEVTKVSDSLLDNISPYFKFPDWVTRPKTTKSYSQASKWKTAEQKGDLNTLTYDDLLSIEGIDEDAATKISRHLKKIGGYQIDNQIYDVYGVPSKIKRLVLNEYTVKKAPVIKKINVNIASASDLSTIPLLDFDLAKEIVDYRLLNEGIKALEELLKLDGMTDYKFQRIRLYLHIE